MSEYNTFQLNFSTILENGNAKAKVYLKDNETEFKDEIEYKIDMTDLEEWGGKYIDNVAEKLLTEAISKLIEQKKQYRETTFNIYDDDIQDGTPKIS